MTLYLVWDIMIPALNDAPEDDNSGQSKDVNVKNVTPRKDHTARRDK